MSKGVTYGIVSNYLSMYNIKYKTKRDYLEERF